LYTLRSCVDGNEKLLTMVWSGIFLNCTSTTVVKAVWMTVEE